MPISDDHTYKINLFSRLHISLPTTAMQYFIDEISGLRLVSSLEKNDTKNHIAMIFRTHAIGSDYERKTYILDVSVVKNFGIDDTIWYGWYHMIHMIWYESWLCPLNYGFDNVAGAGGINFVHDVNIFWFDIFLTFPMQFFPIELGAEVNFGCQSLQAPKFCYNKFWIQ